MSEELMSNPAQRRKLGRGMVMSVDQRADVLGAGDRGADGSDWAFYRDFRIRAGKHSDMWFT